MIGILKPRSSFPAERARAHRSSREHRVPQFQSRQTAARTVLCLALALSAADAVKSGRASSKRALPRPGRAFAGQSKAAWHDTMYYMYWAYYCAIANGTTSSDEDIAECASDEAGNGEVEVEWRWRGYDV